MDDVWPWLASLPLPPPPAAEPDAPPPPLLPLSLPLAASPDGASIILQADAATTTADGDDRGEPQLLATFSLAIKCAGAGAASALWTSDGIAASSPVPLRLQLLIQLLNEVIALSPYVPSLGGTSAFDIATGDASSSDARVDAEAVSGAVGASGGSDDASAPAAAFFSLALLLRVFWLCALDAPAEAGYIFFRDLGADLECALTGCRPALGVFLRSVGPDVEERFMRSLGYMLAKRCLLREMQDAAAAAAAASKAAAPHPRPRRALPAACLSHAAEAHGLWVLKGYAPVLAMARVTGTTAPVTASPHEVPEEPALRYGLVHQQLEAVAQLEYAVRLRGGGRFLAVAVRVDNVRVRVVRLAFQNDDDDAGCGDDDVMDGERHFPSRIRLWVGPRYGASYATGPSLGRSTGNPERDVEMTRTVKGAFSAGAGAAKLANGSAPRMKAKMRSSARTRIRSWRWEQEAEGSAGVFEGVLYDPATGTEVSAWRPGGFGGGAGAGDPRNGMRRRYGGPGRAFSKMRGLVVAGDELPEEMTWRVGREMEGRTLRWRLGLKVWVSYLPNEVRSRHFETRCIEWSHEVELPLAPINGDDS